MGKLVHVVRGTADVDAEDLRRVLLDELTPAIGAVMESWIDRERRFPFATAAYRPGGMGR